MCVQSLLQEGCTLCCLNLRGCVLWDFGQLEREPGGRVPTEGTCYWLISHWHSRCSCCTDQVGWIMYVGLNISNDKWREGNFHFHDTHLKKLYITITHTFLICLSELQSLSEVPTHKWPRMLSIKSSCPIWSVISCFLFSREQMEAGTKTKRGNFACESIITSTQMCAHGFLPCSCLRSDSESPC